MTQYLIILLNDSSTSYCHYRTSTRNRWIDMEDLKKGIRFAMMENLMIQFVYPDDELPRGYSDVINSIDHIDIKPFIEWKMTDGNALVFNGLPSNLLDKYSTVIIRLTPQEFFDFPNYLVREVCQLTKRINVVIREIDPILAWDLYGYKCKIEEISSIVEKEYVSGSTTQWNILTDRMMLSEMKNCGAGDTTITLAPNGKFYVCPAFYYDDMDDSIGDVYTGLNIPNQHLYKLEYAPICRHCDAYQCRRCIWLNRRMTLEVNTPSHEQCVAAHIERNASQMFLGNIRKHGEFLPEIKIREIDYMDPFENREQWKQENL